MWCSEGLECIFNLSEWKAKDDLWSKAGIWDILQDQPHAPRELVPVRNMILRARVNNQRHYEIYTFTADPGIEEDQIRELFETNPQFIVDFIRKNGWKVYGSPATHDRVVIR